MYWFYWSREANGLQWDKEDERTGFSGTEDKEAGYSGTKKLMDWLQWDRNDELAGFSRKEVH